jgi:hypothetical protein
MPLIGHTRMAGWTREERLGPWVAHTMADHSAGGACAAYRGQAPLAEGVLGQALEVVHAANACIAMTHTRREDLRPRPRQSDYP